MELKSRRTVSGMTLIELMVAIAIVAIIGAIAMPNYLGSIRKGRRADASDGAAAVLQAQERWRANNATYTTSFTSLSVSSTTGNGYYTMSLALTGTGSTGYTLTFTPVSSKGQNNDTGCTALSVTLTNGSPVYSPTKCWSR